MGGANGIILPHSFHFGMIFPGFSYGFPTKTGCFGPDTWPKQRPWPPARDFHGAVGPGVVVGSSLTHGDVGVS